MLKTPRSTKPRVALGMSGGVDSSVCAQLLVEQGYDVTGVYLECWRAPGCRTEEDRKDALAVALQLQIPFQVLDFKETYRTKVVEYFFDEYAKGRTPNPDVMCNKEVKFGLFYEWAMSNGFDFVATGHYAQMRTIDGSQTLITSADEHKDQTYFLYRLQQAQLEHILFPIGHLKKTAVRQKAREFHLPVAEKKDSVGICFIGDINVHHFLLERLGKNPGPVVDVNGNVIGQHQGLWFYTVGQRHGFTIDPVTSIIQSDGSSLDKHNIPPFYVIRKIPAKNQLVVGFGAQALADSFDLSDIHWIGKHAEKTTRAAQQLFVRIRHTGELYPCKLENSKVMLNSPVAGIAEGQSAVFYVPLPRVAHEVEKNEFVCLGGGVIESEVS
jgi:tRNA-specific 2-thiouridylase